MIKAIFFDIDGTLVSFKTHAIPQSTLDAIHKVRENGTKVFIATGRPLPFVTNLGEMEYDGIISTSGGSCVTREGEVIFHETIDRKDLENLIAYNTKYPLPIAFASEKEVFITERNDEVDEVYRLLDIRNLGDVRPAEDCLKEEVMQIIAFFKEEDEPYIMQNILPHCEAFRWHPDFADIVKKGVSKASGIDIVLKHYDIKLEECMAFGDGGNDIAMLEHVPHSVAMGNASEEVKKHARYVTDSVDEDGVAKMLAKIKEL